MCLGNSDPRFPACRASMVRSIEVAFPKAAPGKTTVSGFNAQRLEEAAQLLGLEVRRRNERIAEFEPFAADMTNLCGPAIELIVPAPKGNRKQTRRKFVFHARGLDGRRDTDRFVLICR